MDTGVLHPVSIETFVSEIIRQYVENEEVTAEMKQFTYSRQFISDDIDFIAWGYEAGWLEESDALGKSSLLERKTAARIVHQFMRNELKEADEDNTSAARKLQDLYDCRSCAGHVMQVYTKGIMDGHNDPTGRFIFGMSEMVSAKEAEEIVCRLFQVQNRKVQTMDSKVVHEAEMIAAEGALQYLETDKNALLIDVRTNHDFSEKHLEGAKNIPFAAIIKNPYAVSSRRDQLILLYCEEGYQSEIAANCLKEAGYEKVMYFAWKSKI